MNAYKSGTIVAHLNGRTLGQCMESEHGISVHYRFNTGAFGQTEFEPVEVVAKYWRIATAEEVRRYYDAN